MKVLMFGWEFPPHILGGLGTASYGLTKGMSQQEDMEITFCIPRPWGDEDQSFLRIIGMNSTPVVWRDVNWDYVQGRVGSYMNPQLYYDLRDRIYADFNYLNTNDLGCIEFSGRYPANLHEEINNYSIVAGVVARQQEFEIIHSHDWLTYPAGIHAKQVSGKPLVIHVHATDFDRSRGNVNPTVYAIEKNGMDNADHIMCVSELTRQTVINKYFQDPRKVSTVHNVHITCFQHFVHLTSFHETWKMETVGNTSFGHQTDHLIHHITTTGHHETDIARTVQYHSSSFHKIFRTLLHGYAT